LRRQVLDPLKGNALYEAAVKLVRRIYRAIDASEGCTRR
jgi:hypothetical protein